MIKLIMLLRLEAPHYGPDKKSSPTFMSRFFTDIVELNKYKSRMKVQKKLRAKFSYKKAALNMLVKLTSDWKEIVKDNIVSLLAPLKNCLFFITGHLSITMVLILSSIIGSEAERNQMEKVFQFFLRKIERAFLL
jgi:hypothetical protein